MKKTQRIFVLQLLAAFQANRAYCIVRSSTAVQAMAAVLTELGLIRWVQGKDTSGLGLVRRQPKYRGSYLVVWLQYRPARGLGQALLLDTRTSPGRRHWHRPFHRLVLARKRSRFQASKFTLKQSRTPYKNTTMIVHVLETIRGLMTSWEAERLGLGGYIVLTLYLLALNVVSGRREV